MEKFVLIVEVPDARPGEPLIHVGPFDTEDAADQYARKWCAGDVASDRRLEIGTQWCVFPLEVPCPYLDDRRIEVEREQQES